MERATHMARRFAAALAVSALIIVGACATDDAATPVGVNEATTSSVATSTTTVDLGDYPLEARASDGGGDPRPTAYWAVWNSCAPDNRAAEAEANGGRAAGWLLLDDVLADPGIQLGDRLLASCEEGLAYLEGRSTDGESSASPVFDLAGELLAAEMNLTAGAETCPLAEEAVVGAHLILSTANFDGTSDTPLEGEAGGALPQLIDLLTAYNSGELCR